ncbi:PAAR domain-containing protein [Paludibacterium purpuratum]|uniref:Putative Zn-binding protein involved in type VI secretion n=1 Tax=Paludibacterium purpuratum TaxID=1144873 RepID=A0A4V3DVX1_9NEIS|nr:PAAR domain-containing protein [Paludibacterium purpuratum]TDR82639.1 putative Zn-binding protein involved in type VI secretion [Paludibacterium purpuratum]
MARQVITEGCATSHGGKVLGGSTLATIDGLRVAVLGTPCSCPIEGHDDCVIAEGDPDDTLDGLPVAYAGCKTSCGATLLGGGAPCSKE